MLTEDKVIKCLEPNKSMNAYDGIDEINRLNDALRPFGLKYDGVCDGELKLVPLEKDGLDFINKINNINDNEFSANFWKSILLSLVPPDKKDELLNLLLNENEGDK